jgi:hypothetical protein
MVVFPCGEKRNPFAAHHVAMVRRLYSTTESRSTIVGKWRSSERRFQFFDATVPGVTLPGPGMPLLVLSRGRREMGAVSMRVLEFFPAV